MQDSAGSGCWAVHHPHRMHRPRHHCRPHDHGDGDDALRPVLGDSVLGDSVPEDSVLGDFVLGDSVRAGPVAVPDLAVRLAVQDPGCSTAPALERPRRWRAGCSAAAGRAAVVHAAGRVAPAGHAGVHADCGAAPAGDAAGHPAAEEHHWTAPRQGAKPEPEPRSQPKACEKPSPVRPRAQQVLHGRRLLEEAQEAVARRQGPARGGRAAASPREPARQVRSRRQERQPFAPSHAAWARPFPARALGQRRQAPARTPRSSLRACGGLPS
jgi:hypothetical protein